MSGSKEIWKEISEFPGLYEVSNFGRVYSTRSKKILSSIMRNYGETVDLCTCGKQYRRLVGRLVAIEFIPNDDNYDIIKHIDENPKNNNVENLKWAHSKIQINQEQEKVTILDNSDDEWKEVVGYEGLYKVSDKGEVYTVKNNIMMKQRKKGIYYTVNLRKNDKSKNYFVHRLVAIAFIPNPDNKLVVNHIDRNGLNNNIKNLEWVTYSENSIHANKTEKHPKNKIKQLENYNTEYNGEELHNIKDCDTRKVTKTGKIYNIGKKSYTKPYVSNGGYLTTVINNKTLQIHRIIAQTFIPNPENKPLVNHKDGNKHNNDVNNLEWVTDSENTKHAYKMELIKVSKICQFDKSGKFINIFSNLKEAKEKTKLSIHSNDMAGDYIFYKEEDCTKINDAYHLDKNILQKFIDRGKGSEKRELCKFSLDKKFIKKYESVAEACRENNIIIRSLRKSLSINKGTFKDNIWLYADECEEENGFYKIKEIKKKQKDKMDKSKMIGQYDLDGNLMEIFNSIGEAHKKGYNKNLIKKVLNGDKTEAYGFKWNIFNDEKNSSDSESKTEEKPKKIIKKVATKESQSSEPEIEEKPKKVIKKSQLPNKKK